MSNKNHSVVRTGILCLLAFNLVACQKQKLNVPSDGTVSEQLISVEAARKQREEERLQLCQKQLSALHYLNEKQYRHYRQAFDNLMNNASQYAGLRERVNNDTQETIDALYRYKANYLCSCVDNAVLVGLTERAK